VGDDVSDVRYTSDMVARSADTSEGCCIPDRAIDVSSMLMVVT
jgi:hypothetical protein